MSAYEPMGYVLAGVDFLDEVQPGWADLIDWEVLDIEDLNNCVAGQLDRRLGMASFVRKEEGRTGDMFFYDNHIRHGMEAPYGYRNSADYAALTAAWKQWHSENSAEMVNEDV